MTRINSKCLQNRRFYGVTTVLPTHVAYCCPEPRICGLFCTCSRSPASPAAAHAPPAATRPLHRRVQPAIPAVRWRLSYAPPVRGALTEDITPRACSLHVQGGQDCWLLHRPPTFWRPPPSRPRASSRLGSRE